MVSFNKAVNLICLIVAIIGVILVLYSANITLYNPSTSFTQTVGWAGTYMFLGSVVFVIVFYVYNYFSKPKMETKKEEKPSQKP